VLSRVFRGKFVAGQQRAFRQGKLVLQGRLRRSAKPKIFRLWLRSLFRNDWVVYAKKPFGGPEYVLSYLARYTHRVANSNHRLIFMQGDQVTFRWKDYAHGNRKRKMTLPANEFLRRFFLHVLPRGFVRIRHFGFLANPRRSKTAALCQRLLTGSPGCSSSVEKAGDTPSPATWRCLCCGAPMVLVERLTPQQLRLPSPGRPNAADTSSSGFACVTNFKALQTDRRGVSTGSDFRQNATAG
jgi:hypothetical protein